MATVKRRLIQEAERVNPVAPVHIWRSPAGAAVDMLIVTAPRRLLRHARARVESLPNETGGFLLGRVAIDARDGCWHLEIEEAVPVEPLTQDPVHFTFTWRDVDRVRSYREEQGKALLGWYHTHPGSGHLPLGDRSRADASGAVLRAVPDRACYDPVRGRAGYFFWEGPDSSTLPRGRLARVRNRGAPSPEPERTAPPPPPASTQSSGGTEPTADEPPAPPAPDVPAASWTWTRRAPHVATHSCCGPVGVSLLFIVTGLAAGDFWFGPARGLP